MNCLSTSSELPLKPLYQERFIIPILGYITPENFTKRKFVSLSHDILNHLHFSLPISATFYHEQILCSQQATTGGAELNILKGSLISSEVSPKYSRTARYCPDHGTIIESLRKGEFIYICLHRLLTIESNIIIKGYSEIRLRRIGDKRLTFVQFDDTPCLHDSTHFPDYHSILQYSELIPRLANQVIIR